MKYLTPDEQRAETLAIRRWRAERRAGNVPPQDPPRGRVRTPRAPLMLQPIPPANFDIRDGMRARQRKRSRFTEIRDDFTEGPNRLCTIVGHDTANGRLVVRLSGARRDTFMRPRALRRGWLPEATR